MDSKTWLLSISKKSLTTQNYLETTKNYLISTKNNTLAFFKIIQLQLRVNTPLVQFAITEIRQLVVITVKKKLKLKTMVMSAIIHVLQK